MLRWTWNTTSATSRARRKYVCITWLLTRALQLPTIVLVVVTGFLRSDNLFAQERKGSAPARIAAWRSRVVNAKGNEPVREILANGRHIAAVGAWVGTAPNPFTLAVRPDAEQLTIRSIGWPFSLNIVDRPNSAGHVFTRKIPSGRKNGPNVQVMTGVVSSPDGKVCTAALAIPALLTSTRRRAGGACSA